MCAGAIGSVRIERDPAFALVLRMSRYSRLKIRRVEQQRCSGYVDDGRMFEGGLGPTRGLSELPAVDRNWQPCLLSRRRVAQFEAERGGGSFWGNSEAALNALRLVVITTWRSTGAVSACAMHALASDPRFSKLSQCGNQTENVTSPRCIARGAM
jgi:hypothetical protein